MKKNNALFFAIGLSVLVSNVFGLSFPLKEGRFDIEKDLLLVQMDCKTDVDDIHTAAAFFTLMSHPDFSKINYYPVAGTYGIQEGLYVSPNEVLNLAFGSKWADAHEDADRALKVVLKKAMKTLKSGGDVWIAEAGQSDFTARLVRELQIARPDLNLRERIHVVQHSNWNEEVTSKSSLEFIKATIDYHKIPDGNAVGNGTPGFRTPGYSQWKSEISNSKLRSVWDLAVEIGLKYNGVEGRYNNNAIEENGLDFSDLSEVCWILGLEEIKDTEEFFRRYAY
ncbi:hypothetical protein [Algoriphagus mannitolivorans]|uniref:hypothetical protein n=1 Tax=Algoriphagus mannitolivorans TaxID=226504 RepID=UPI0003FF7342|nr:hypothetical protein [Algoriphagus mannitolivorans]